MWRTFKKYAAAAGVGVGVYILGYLYLGFLSLGRIENPDPDWCFRIICRPGVADWVDRSNIIEILLIFPAILMFLGVLSTISFNKPKNIKKKNKK